ncbi:polymorphic toxin-type HINT domain-containing protein [Paludisphaera rhizosphaerae]|uniref:polymorphic toxin-type HINT domain-containing protein n=1 Tax=Paludisphaera rhizosphaerae TaxID=2711216 RepID=UPI0013EC2DA6|nr:polymorphic toxin-type HINT domain-containing protein [Paludisphaera rhizosphaerae]
MIAAWMLVGILGVFAPDDAPKPSDADLAAYEAAVAAAGRDPESQVKLALWCEAHGMPAERLKHLTRAVLLDPNNAKARGLLGQVQRDGKWMRADDVAKAVEAAPDQQALQREYLDRRARTRDDADGHYKLALWCEARSLTEPMIAHLHRTLQLDPNREGALRRLGFKKIGGRWVNVEAENAFKAAREAQEKADREWKPKLEKLRTALTARDSAKRDQAQAELAAIRDPRAVSMIFQLFAKGGDESRQKTAVDAFSRIDGPMAGVALATLAVFSPHGIIRTDAAALLQRRDPREFAGFLADLIQDEVKYKVKPIDGPGGQGELLIEGRDVDVRRVYQTFNVPGTFPGDQIGTDANGNVVVNRPVGAPYLGAPPNAATIWAMASGNPIVGFGWPNGFGIFWSPPNNPAAAVSTLEKAGIPSGLSNTVVGRIQHSNTTMASAYGLAAYAGFWGTGRLRPVYQDSIQIPLQQMEAEAQRAALISRQQLAADVAGIEAHNEPIRQINERAVAVLKGISGLDVGADRGQWINWVLDLQGFAKQPMRAATPSATVVEEVAPAYQPQVVGFPATNLVGFVRSHSCFAGGTTVRTLRGEQPIEQIERGDLVLTQDPITGALAYKAVVEAFHNPPNELYAIDMGRDTVRATGIHRFWKAGEGWVMARDLKAGDRLRTIGGTVEVVSVTKQAAEPVFNLMVSGGNDFCVGSLGLLAHDNSLVEPVAQPFDGVPTTRELAAAKP